MKGLIEKLVLFLFKLCKNLRHVQTDIVDCFDSFQIFSFIYQFLEFKKNRLKIKIKTPPAK